jgi:hypothetical protein
VGQYLVVTQTTKILLYLYVDRCRGIVVGGGVLVVVMWCCCYVTVMLCQLPKISYTLSMIRTNTHRLCALIAPDFRLMFALKVLLLYCAFNLVTVNIVTRLIGQIVKFVHTGDSYKDNNNHDSDYDSFCYFHRDFDYSVKLASSGEVVHDDTFTHLRF